MLKRKEKFILKNLNEECGSGNSCLITLKRLALTPSGHKKITEQELEKILVALEEQNFLDAVKSTRMGEEIYCVTLKLKGKHYLIENENALRAMKFRVLVAVLGAIASFIMGKLLFMLF